MAIEIVCCTTCLISWLRELENGNVVVLLCSDVKGAFDRVSKNILLDRLGKLEIPRNLWSLIESWLDDRAFQVVTEGSYSSTKVLRDSAYQGTVLGPPLWNQHFKSSRHAINEAGFTESVYADDENAFKSFSRDTSTDVLNAQLILCQGNLHSWGLGNQV